MSTGRKTTSPIGESIAKSLMSVDSLKDSSLIFISSIENEVKQARKKFKHEAEPFKEVVSIEDVEGEEKKRIVFNIPASHRRKIIEKHTRLKRMVTAQSIIPRNFLIAYVSEFDYFVGSLLRSIYTLKPELLNASDRVFNFKDLCKFSSLDDVREEVIEKDIEQILRSSHTEQFKTIAAKVDIETLTQFDNWAKFIEITERRNLFVHADGIISTQYQKVCNSVKIKIKDDQIGEKLDCSIEYLNHTYEIMYEVIVKLGQTLWRKLFGKSLEQRVLADEYLINILFELLCTEQYGLVINLGEFALQQKSISNEFNRRMMVINLCLAYKYSKNESKLQELLNKHDWSAIPDIFQLAIACINDEYTISCKLIKKLIQHNSEYLNEGSLHSWPLFKILKEQDCFKEMYLELFKTSFSKVSIIDEPDLQEDISHANLEVSEADVASGQDLSDSINQSSSNDGEEHAHLEVNEADVASGQDLPDSINQSSSNDGEEHAHLEVNEADVASDQDVPDSKK